MSTHAQSAPTTDRRPLLALLLGLLGLPGCTLAWDLPAGGFWIGLPLAIAAVVVGARARPATAATVGLFLGVVEILFTVTWTVASIFG